MAAPERFAETSDSSCTAGAVHTWPVSTNRGSATIRPESEEKPTLREHRKSVESDPEQTIRKLPMSRWAGVCPDEAADL
jgi:hypothetical protein